jgi:ATP-dependent Clp protease ATP-binding subunit ClpC
VFNILLQMLEEGRLTDAQGRHVDFRNTIVIMTSNIGASSIAKNTSLGFSVEESETGVSYEDMKNRIMGDVKKMFRPELLNRIDEIIVFQKLTKAEITQIVDLLMKRLREQMKVHEVSIELTDKAKDFMVDKGYDPTMGARPLRRAIQRYVEDPLADFVLRSQVPEGSTVMVDAPADGDTPEGVDPEVKLTVIEPAPKPTPVGVGAEGGPGEGGDESGDDVPVVEEPETPPEGE